MEKLFLSRLVKISRKLSKVVAKIVNNSSPEGVYPEEDLKDFDNENQVSST